MAIPNTLFALFAASDPPAIMARMGAPGVSFLNYQTSGDSWLVIAPSAVTTIELCTLLGITDGTGGSGIVVRSENYYGRANTAIWEWVTAKMGVTLDSSVNQTSTG